MNYSLKFFGSLRETLAAIRDRERERESAHCSLGFKVNLHEISLLIMNLYLRLVSLKSRLSTADS